MDAIVAKPYIAAAEQKLHYNDYVLTLADQILTELAAALNRFHETEHSKRYWNIVLGHWLQRYVSVAFDRYQTLDEAIKNYEVDGTTIFEATDYSLATRDSESFIWACNDDSWNHVLLSRLITYRGDIDANVDSTSLRGSFSVIRKETRERRAQIIRLIRKIVNRVNPILARDTDAFIVNSYLPIWEGIKLQLALGQVPQAWQSPSIASAPPDTGARANVILEHGQHKGFENYVRRQLPALIPTCYLEGYRAIARKAEALPWPKRPKFIYTSNNFDMDEFFKVWTGSKIEIGVPYYIGQHGGYQPNRARPKQPEIVISDRFLTWGWTDERKENIPAFAFKIVATRPKEFDPKGGLLLIEQPLPHWLGPLYLNTLDYYEYGVYAESQFCFAEALPTRIHRELTVRLHGTFKRLAWSDEERWRDRSPNTKIEPGIAHIQKLIAKSRLVVHSYDSTGIRETLALNIPTMCFWSGGLDHLLPSARPYYELLNSAEILIGSPKRAAELVALRWDNISKWWESTSVQNAREEFCSQYARTEAHPVRTMKRLLTS